MEYIIYFTNGIELKILGTDSCWDKNNDTFKIYIGDDIVARFRVTGIAGVIYHSLTLKENKQDEY